MAARRRTVPPVGSSRPAAICSSVVLPLPLCPTRATVGPPDVDVERCERRRSPGRVAVRLGQLDELPVRRSCRHRAPLLLARSAWPSAMKPAELAPPAILAIAHPVRRRSERRAARSRARAARARRSRCRAVDAVRARAHEQDGGRADGTDHDRRDHDAQQRRHAGHLRRHERLLAVARRRVRGVAHDADHATCRAGEHGRQRQDRRPAAMRLLVVPSDRDGARRPRRRRRTGSARRPARRDGGPSARPVRSGRLSVRSGWSTSCDSGSNASRPSTNSSNAVPIRCRRRATNDHRLAARRPPRRAPPSAPGASSGSGARLCQHRGATTGRRTSDAAPRIHGRRRVCSWLSWRRSRITVRRSCMVTAKRSWATRLLRRARASSDVAAAC